MAQLYFSRDVKVYIQTAAATWQVPILDGYSFSQGTNSVEVTLAEMSGTAGVSKRGRKMFNDSLAPAEWSFSTYARPFTAAGAALAQHQTHASTSGVGSADAAAETHAVEEVLWALAAGAAVYDPSDHAFKSAGAVAYTTPGTGTQAITFAQSNLSALGTATIWFAFPDADGGTDIAVYKLNKCVVNEATMNFDIDGIAQIDWSGMGSEVEESDQTALNTAIAVTGSGIYIDEGMGCDVTGNFIRNRLSTMTLTAANTTVFPGASTNGVYNIVLTGGSVTVSNNITFLTPSELGCVNIPLGHVTGSRSISGSIDCYLNNDADELGGSGELFEDLTSNAGRVLATNSFALTLNVGGTTGPAVTFAMPTAHLEIPAHDLQDVVSLTTSFHALPSTIDGADELTVTYKS